MLQDIIIIDNFFKDPDSIVEFANQQNYEENDFKFCGWRGFRTKRIHEINRLKSDNITDEFFNNIFIRCLPKFMVEYEWSGDFFFHRLGKNIKFDHKWIHRDDNTDKIYAGVVYLNKHPIENSGTFIIKNDDIIEIDNRYNRLLLYKTDYLHSAMCGFGDGEYSRLTLTMFIRKININIKTCDDGKYDE